MEAEKYLFAHGGNVTAKYHHDMENASRQTQCGTENRAAVQSSCELPARVTQRAQIAVQKEVFAPVLVGIGVRARRVETSLHFPH